MDRQTKKFKKGVKGQCSLCSAQGVPLHQTCEPLRVFKRRKYLSRTVITLHCY
jgi:hypothetical protein